MWSPTPIFNFQYVSLKFVWKKIDAGIFVFDFVKFHLNELGSAVEMKTLQSFLVQAVTPTLLTN